MRTSHFSTPPQERYLEDYVTGAVHEFGPIGISEAQIVEFGRQFDPQLFHTDPEGARQTPMGPALFVSGCGGTVKNFVTSLSAETFMMNAPGS